MGLSREKESQAFSRKWKKKLFRIELGNFSQVETNTLGFLQLQSLDVRNKKAQKLKTETQVRNNGVGGGGTLNSEEFGVFERKK